MPILRISLENGTAASFMQAMDEVNIDYGEVMLFSNRPDPENVIVGIVREFMELMPWNALARVAVAWKEADASREIRLLRSDNTDVSIKGYSAKAVEKMGPTIIAILVTQNRNPAADFIPDNSDAVPPA